jgi:hypothetical protein
MFRVLSLLLAGSAAAAEKPPANPPANPPTATSPRAADWLTAPPPSELDAYAFPVSDDERMAALEERIEVLERQLQQAQETKIRPDVVVNFTGYADLGFFVPQGDGSGTVQDFGNARFPQYAGRFGWMFLGDLLAPTVNSRGEVADLGNLPGVTRFDSIHSKGAPGFLVNEANLTVVAGLTDRLLLTTSLNFVPRTGSEFALGDFFDLDIAQVEWLPWGNRRFSLFVGKFDSVIGIEYRDRKSTARFGITPSLMARYTVGTPIGIKARAKLLKDEILVIAAAVTNGTSTTEQFHFYNEIDTNITKTVSGRVSLRLPVPGSLEVGLSGEYGAQDRASNNRGAMWFAGVDLLYFLHDLSIKAQWLRGMSPGEPVDDVYGLALNHGGYLEVNYMVTPKLGILARGEVRDAFVWLGEERAYLTKGWRGTLGARWTFNQHAVLKAEYLRNGEYGGTGNIRNDIFTSSLVVSF